MVRAARRDPSLQLSPDLTSHRIVHLRLIEINLNELPPMATRAFHAHMRRMRYCGILHLRSIFQRSPRICDQADRLAPVAARLNSSSCRRNPLLPRQLPRPLPASCSRQRQQRMTRLLRLHRAALRPKVPAASACTLLLQVCGRPASDGLPPP